LLYKDLRHKKPRAPLTFTDYLKSYKAKDAKVKEDKLNQFRLERDEFVNQEKKLQMNLDKLLLNDNFFNNKKVLLKKWEKVQFDLQTHLNMLRELKKEEKDLIDMLKKIYIDGLEFPLDHLKSVKEENEREQIDLLVKLEKLKLEKVKELEIFEVLKKNEKNLNFEFEKLESNKYNERVLRNKLDKLEFKKGENERKQMAFLGEDWRVEMGLMKY